MLLGYFLFVVKIIILTNKKVLKREGITHTCYVAMPRFLSTSKEK